MDEDFQAKFDKAIQAYALKNQYSVSRIPYHSHTGADSPRVDPKNLIGFPCISVTDATVAPTDTPENGTVRFLYDSTHWHLWVRINNLWKGVALA